MLKDINMIKILFEVITMMILYQLVRDWYLVLNRKMKLFHCITYSILSLISFILLFHFELINYKSYKTWIDFYIILCSVWSIYSSYRQRIDYNKPFNCWKNVFINGILNFFIFPYSFYYVVKFKKLK
jgi:hypothetical protein